LIELLVVVAIIAVLAAIALPRYRETVVKAKLAEAQSNLRTLAQALYRYHVDTGELPPARYYRDDLRCWQTPPELTTPNPYLHAPPPDPFDKLQSTSERKVSIKYLHPGPGFRNGRPTHESNPIYMWLQDPADPDNPAADIRVTDDSGPVKWAIWSVGPDGTSEFHPGQPDPHEPVPRRFWYDPTNGLNSNGNMVRLSDGQGS
jgi:type II secretory pathway pseudopilin PulG